MKIHSTLKLLRRKKGLTQKSMADELCMARSTYSKLESGNTALPYEKLIAISKVLDIPIYEIMKEDSGFLISLSDKFSLMLHQTYTTLADLMLTMVPYDNLRPQHFTLLMAKGFASRNAYENTLMKGRLYGFGPREVFNWMVQFCGMAVFFEENMIKEEHWLKKWKDYKSNNYPEFEIDEKDYFKVHIFILTMPDGEEKTVQFAVRDFPGDLDEWEQLEYIIDKTGAVDGDYMATAYDGYFPFYEIVK